VGNASIAVVNDAFAKQLGGTRAVGQRITLADREREIVGVVASITEVGEIQGGVIKRAGFRRLTTPAVYVPSGTEYEGEPEPFDVILVRSALPVQVVSRAVAGQLRRFDPELTIRRAGSLEQQIRTIGADARFFATIIAAFAVVSLVLACVGLCGLLAQAVAQRLREIGIRVALGAGPVRVVWLVVSEGAVLVGAGLILGLPLSGAAGKAATALLFEVGPADPLTLTAASILLAVVAAAALWAPARRAARVDVVAMLKAE
jgi:ABC-type antimicrobial peptide transport system permease subunit